MAISTANFSIGHFQHINFWPTEKCYSDSLNPKRILIELKTILQSFGKRTTLMCIACAYYSNHIFADNELLNSVDKHCWPECLLRKKCKTTIAFDFDISRIHAKKSIKLHPALFISFSFFFFWFYCISYTWYSLRTGKNRISNIEPSKHVIAFIWMQMEISMLHTHDLPLKTYCWLWSN